MQVVPQIRELSSSAVVALSSALLRSALLCSSSAQLWSPSGHFSMAQFPRLAQHPVTAIAPELSTRANCKYSCSSTSAHYISVHWVQWVEASVDIETTGELIYIHLLLFSSMLV